VVLNWGFVLLFKLAHTYSADRMRIVQSGSEREDLLEVA
jgi:hypothetical protein